MADKKEPMLHGCGEGSELPSAAGEKEPPLELEDVAAEAAAVAAAKARPRFVRGSVLLGSLIAASLFYSLYSMFSNL